MLRNFLTPRTERLHADGTLESVHEPGLLGRFRPPVILLARNLCAFSFFETTVLPANRRRQAARLYARANSPYVVSGVALVRTGRDFGVWWWDLERILPLLAPQARGASALLRPETLAQPIGEGWRIVRLNEGYEGQFWRAKGLLASVWRRNRFDNAAWSTFTSLQRAASPAPEAPPTAEQLPISPDGEAFAFAFSEISREQAVALAGGGFACVVAATVFLMLGQGLRLADDSRRVDAETATIVAATARPASAQGLELDRRKLVAYRQLEEQTNPVTAAGAAIGIVAFHDLTPTGLDVRDDVLTLTLPYPAIDATDELVAEFDNSGYFYDVRPRTEPGAQKIIFEMKIRAAAPPLSAGG